ncbi:MAG: cyclic nucleotide-binding domain-containing protein [Deltaproteobacteria bacterium]|nr:cyclic nucleotide-binding domain-containing protein [Deltaproteobacteria bacterium]
MNKKLGMTAEELRAIPLLRSMSNDQLAQVASLFEPAKAAKGTTLFEIGDPAQALYLLVEGEVTLHRTDEETHRLTGPAIIGELGALTGLCRNSRAVIGQEAKIWEIKGELLLELFVDQPELALRFEQSLLEMAGDKIQRDQLRLIDMRTNLIRTQKAMKQMRDFLLESEDTIVSEKLHGVLDTLIRQNRRVNYRVEPPPALTATARVAKGKNNPVMEISRSHVSYKCDGTLPPKQGDRVTGVLNLSGPEVPFSGKVLRTVKSRVDVELDLLMDEYVVLLEGYLTRIQMLDFLV